MSKIFFPIPKEDEVIRCKDCKYFKLDPQLICKYGDWTSPAKELIDKAIEVNWTCIGWCSKAETGEWGDIYGWCHMAVRRKDGDLLV